jgi:hypothetical protein
MNQVTLTLAAYDACLSPLVHSKVVWPDTQHRTVAVIMHATRHMPQSNSVHTGVRAYEHLHPCNAAAQKSEVQKCQLPHVHCNNTYGLLRGQTVS